MRHGPALALVGITFVFAWAYPASTQDAGPHLTVRTADGQGTYYIGQRIPLELSFTGPDNRRYEINMSSYDRSGRMSYEEFEVSPSAGWADPLEAYFGGGAGSMGGMTGFRALSPTPIIINLDLNEWVRFDRPGTYNVFIVSHRVGDVSQGRVFIPFGQGTNLKSNPIELHIIPAPPAWQRVKLAAVFSRIEAVPKQPGIEPPALKSAIADLRFLGTPAAARVMTQHVREDEPALMYECMLGLAGLRASVHPAALAAMNNLIADPNFPVSQTFLTAMSVLQITSSDPSSQREERERLENENWTLALQVLPTKQGKARAATAQTLASWQRAPFSPAQNAELARILASSLKDLPIEKQTGELQWNWDLLRDQISRSTLQQLAKAPLKDPQSNEMNSYNTRNLKSVALQRWYELDPESAHEEILRQIGSPNPSLSADALSFLPDNEKLPQFEGLWADEFMATDDNQREALFARLLVRFGTGSAVGLVMEKENSKIGDGVCTLPDSALAYVLKFDSESARPLAQRAFRGAGDGKSGCRFSFQNIARSMTSPVLTELALETLDDPNPQVVADALIYLMDYGDKSVEQSIWNRYVEWSEKWRGRADVLESREAGSTNNNWEEIAVGENLARALIANQGWLAIPDLIARVLERCVGEQMCTQLKQLATQGQPGAVPYAVSAYRNGPNQNYQIAQYNLKSLELLEAKIAQFPRGTRFSLGETSPQNQDQKKLEDQVQALFEKNGMILERPGSDGSQ